VTDNELQRRREGSRTHAIRASKRGAKLAAKDRQLATQHHDLPLFEFPRAAGERDQLEQTPQGEVEQRSEQAQPRVSRTKASDAMESSAAEVRCRRGGRAAATAH
jgi:hypothetical protein